MTHKKLGFGLMRLPLKENDSNVIDDIELNKMVDLFIKNKFKYFDTSYVYHNGESETAIKKALVDRYQRCDYLLANKLPVFIISKKEEVENIFEEQLEKCGVSYFDYYLLHNLNLENYEHQVTQLEMFDYLKIKKSEGKIRKIGFSFHDSFDILDKILTEHPEVDFVQIALNYYDWESQSIQSRLCYETIIKHNKEVIVMEPVKGGMLSTLDEYCMDLFDDLNPTYSTTSWAIRFSASLQNVSTVLSGMSSNKQMIDNISYMNEFRQLTGQETSRLLSIAEKWREKKVINCSRCQHCINVCPKSIEISTILEIYNSIMNQPNPQFNAELNYYKNIKYKEHGFDQCDSCMKCDRVCPNDLNIYNELKHVTDFLMKYGF